MEKNEPMAFNKFYEQPSRTEANTQTDGKFPRRKSPFLRMENGVDYILRFRPFEVDRDGDPVPGVVFYRYWIPTARKQGPRQEASVIVGFNNPIKDRMTEMQRETGLPKPEGFKKPERRVYLNVLDRTPVVRDSTGEVYYQNGVDPRTRNPTYPTKARNGESLEGQTPTPRNEILILECGPMLLNDINKYDGRTMNTYTREYAKVHEIDFLISRTAKPRPNGPPEVSFVVLPHFNHEPLPQELRNLPLFDIRLMAQPLPNDLVEATVYGELDFYEALRTAVERQGREMASYPMTPAFDADKPVTEAATGETEKLDTEEVPF